MPNCLAAHNGIIGRACLAQPTPRGKVFGAMDASTDKPPASTNVPGESPAAHAPDLGEIALVMGGGGARGAYQVGLLRYLARRYPNLRLPILTGVSRQDARNWPAPSSMWRAARSFGRSASRRRIVVLETCWS